MHGRERCFYSNAAAAAPVVEVGVVRVVEVCSLIEYSSRVLAFCVYYTTHAPLRHGPRAASAFPMNAMDTPPVRAPAFPDTLDWVHSGGGPLTLADFRGKLLLLDFWTYG